MSHSLGPSDRTLEGSSEPNPTPELIRRIQQGIDREESFRQLFQLHRLRVVKFFQRKGFSSQEIPDFTQDVFLRVFRAIDHFRGDSSFEWWLLEIADNVFKNELRRKSAEKREGIEQSMNAPVSKDGARTVGDRLISEFPTPLSETERREQARLLRAAVKEFPPQMLLAFRYRYENDLKYQEIAERMGISIETVKAHLFQGRKRLIAKLGGTSKDKT